MYTNEGTVSQKPSFIFSRTIKARNISVPSPKEDMMSMGV